MKTNIYIFYFIFFSHIKKIFSKALTLSFFQLYVTKKIQTYRNVERTVQ